MQPLEKLFDKHTNALIQRYNAMNKLNSFLYKNPDCNDLLKELTSQDRWEFVTAKNKIECELIPYVHDNFHNMKCEVNGTAGIIVHDKTRVFENRTLDNNVSMRRRFEDAEYSEPETIALWVDTGNKYSTHLYPASQIMV